MLSGFFFFVLFEIGYFFCIERNKKKFKQKKTRINWYIVVIWLCWTSRLNEYQTLLNCHNDHLFIFVCWIDHGNQGKRKKCQTKQIFFNCVIDNDHHQRLLSLDCADQILCNFIVKINRIMSRQFLFSIFFLGKKIKECHEWMMT